MSVVGIDLYELTEKQFEQQLIGSNGKPGIARVLGWRCYHTLRSKGSEPGYPDWTLVRERVVFLELKRETGKISGPQRDWLVALLAAGAEAYIVKPSHLDAITTVLRARGRGDGLLFADDAHIGVAVATLNAELARQRVIASPRPHDREETTLQTHEAAD